MLCTFQKSLNFCEDTLQTQLFIMDIQMTLEPNSEFPKEFFLLKWYPWIHRLAMVSNEAEEFGKWLKRRLESIAKQSFPFVVIRQKPKLLTCFLTCFVCPAAHCSHINKTLHSCLIEKNRAKVVARAFLWTYNTNPSNDFFRSS